MVADEADRAYVCGDWEGAVCLLEGTIRTAVHTAVAKSRVCLSDDDVEDLRQEARLRIWRGRGAYVPREGVPLRCWAHVVAYNAAVTHIRRTTIVRTPLAVFDSADDMVLALELLPAERSTTDPFNGISAEQARREAVKPLAEIKHFDAVMWADYLIAGAQYRQIAAAERLPLGTVRSRISRMRDRLRGCLAEERDG